MQTRTSKSEVFTAYNILRRYFGASVADSDKLRRALGICLSKGVSPYVTTLESCSCPQFEHRELPLPEEMRHPCKHMVALAIKEIIVHGLHNDTAPPKA